MPFEKLTNPNYIAGQLSETFYLGVIIFENITKMHPYVNQKSIKTQKDYVAALKAANIAKPKLYSTYSLQLQSLLDLVLTMCAKLRKNRISCKKLF